MRKKILLILIACIFLFCPKISAKTFLSEDISVNNYKIYEKVPEYSFGSGTEECKDILGQNLTALVKTGVKAIQIVGAIVAIVNGMITLIPAIMSKDADGLKKAEKKLVYMAIVLLCIFLLPYIIRWIGMVFEYDVSCIF